MVFDEAEGGRGLRVNGHVRGKLILIISGRVSGFTSQARKCQVVYHSNSLGALLSMSRDRHKEKPVAGRANQEKLCS